MTRSACHFSRAYRVPSNLPPATGHGTHLFTSNPSLSTALISNVLPKFLRFYVNTQANPPQTTWSHPAGAAPQPPHFSPPSGPPPPGQGGPPGYDNRGSPFGGPPQIPQPFGSGPPTPYNNGPPTPYGGGGGYQPGYNQSPPPQQYGGYGQPPPQQYGGGGYQDQRGAS